VINETLRWLHQEAQASRGGPGKPRLEVVERPDGSAYVVVRCWSKYAKIEQGVLADIQAKANEGLEIYRFSTDLGYRWIPPVGVTVSGNDVRHDPTTGAHPRFKRGGL
jgi:hypothetical protein